MKTTALFTSATLVGAAVAPRTLLTWNEDCLRESPSLRHAALGKAAKVLLAAVTDDDEMTTTAAPLSNLTDEEAEAGAELKKALKNKKMGRREKTAVVADFVKLAHSELGAASARRLASSNGKEHEMFKKRDEVIGVLSAFSKSLQANGVGEDEDDGEFFGYIGVDVLPANQEKGLIEKTAKLMPCVAAAEDDQPREIQLADSRDVQGMQEDVNTVYANIDFDWWVHSYFYGDAMSSFQWYFGSSPGVRHLAAMEFLKAEEVRFADVTVAVVDSECQTGNDDINWEVNEDEIPDNGIDDDNNNVVDDYQGYDFGGNDSDTSTETGKAHGSTVSAIIGAKSYNGRGLHGMCPHCKVVCYKAARGGVLYTSLILRAINAIIERGDIRISNHSYGGFGPLVAEYQAFRRLNATNHLIITAAGNSGCDMTTSNSCNSNGVAMVPAMYDLDKIVSVGSIDIDNKRSWFSNHGDNVVDIWAPGNLIVAFNSAKADAFMFSRGTSYAAPIVAGAAALALSANPSLTAEELRDMLYSTSAVTDESQEQWGRHGQLDVEQLVKEALN